MTGEKPFVDGGEFMAALVKLVESITRFRQTFVLPDYGYRVSDTEVVFVVIQKTPGCEPRPFIYLIERKEDGTFHASHCDPEIVKIGLRI